MVCRHEVLFYVLTVKRLYFNSMTSLKVFTLLLLVNFRTSFGFGFKNQLWWLDSFTKEFHRRSEDQDVDPSQWIVQPLNHFDANETRTWKMQYFEDLQFWQSNGPIIIYVGGEGPISAEDLKLSLITSFAEEVKGALFRNEHRFYGRSIPSDGLVMDNLSYLSSMQALADLKYFIFHLKSLKEYENSSVVVVGCSYSGNLAAWSRLLYPDLVNAALAVSAPVLAKVDFFEYSVTVGKDINKFNPNCYGAILNKIESYNQLLQTSEGIKQLKKNENICNHVDFTEKNNINLFYFFKLGSYSLLAQYGTPHQIERDCLKTFDFDNYISVLYNGTCVDYTFANFIHLIHNCAYHNVISWYYQTCAEFGYFQTTAVDSFPFNINVSEDFYFDVCSGLFGPEFTRESIQDSVDKTNERYHGLKLNVEKVFFLNGDMDPWHTLGILKDLSEEAPARVIENASHCAGLRDENVNKEILEFRELIKKKLKEWIGMH